MCCCVGLVHLTNSMSSSSVSLPIPVPNNTPSSLSSSVPSSSDGTTRTATSTIRGSSSSSSNQADGSNSSNSSRNSRAAASEVTSVALDSSSPVVFVALHAGAGYHNPAHFVELQELFHASCQLALTQAGSAEEAVYLAIQQLEASPLTNAGRGSVLTEDGRVECEASMMLGNGAYSGVGAVCGVEHPIQLAYQLVKERNEYGLIKEMGRVRPILLVGEGAWKYAEEKGFARVGPQEWHDHHVTEETRKKWKKYKALIDKHKKRQANEREQLRRDAQQRVADEQRRVQQRGRRSEPQPHDQPSSAAKKRPRSPRSPSASSSSSPLTDISPPNPKPAASHDGDDDDGSTDTSFHGKQHGTVGAIACDNQGNVCAGVSSGGIWMKTAGRIGSAALIGCGCHAENGDDDGETGSQVGKSTADSMSVACSISGCGENIIEELMAVRCCDAMKNAKLSSPPKPNDPIVEIDASVSSDSSDHGHGDGSSDHHSRQQHQSEMQRIMKQLIEKEQVRQSGFTASDLNRKKRQKNAQGSHDTQQQDDGLSSGIIACRVVKRSKAAEAAGGSSGGEERMVDDVESSGGGAELDDLTLEFCYAHTAPHFAVGYAFNDSINGYHNKGWISQQTREQTQDKTMKIGQMTVNIRPHQLQHSDDGDSGGESDETATRAERGQQREQKREDEEENDEDGHVAEATDGAQRNGQKREVKRRKEGGGGKDDEEKSGAGRDSDMDNKNGRHE